MLNRRSLITGLISLVAAPAIVRPTSIMSIKALPTVEDLDALARKQLAGYLVAVTRQAFVPRFFVSADLTIKYLDERWEPDASIPPGALDTM
jgi:hypothetical protein